MPTTMSSRRGRRANPALTEAWKERLLRYEQSVLSVQDFCTQEQVSPHSFYSWRRRLAPPVDPSLQQATQARLVPIHLLPTPVTPLIDLLLPSGAILRLSPGCDLAFVRSLVLALGEQPC